MIKKGDTIYQAGDWDGKGTYIVKKYTVQSCGKVRMTVTDFFNDRKAREFIYASSVTGEYKNCFNANQYTEQQIMDMYIGEAVFTQAWAIESQQNFIAEIKHPSAIIAQKEKLLKILAITPSVRTKREIYEEKGYYW
jgi:hypothetical protein